MLTQAGLILPEWRENDPKASYNELRAAIGAYFRRLNEPNVLAIEAAKLTATNGIKFPAVASNSTDVNTLDDYEENSSNHAFTLIGSTTPGTQTYASQLGRYTKVGRLVFIEGLIVLSAKDAAMAGNVLIGNLPFGTGAQEIFGSFAFSYAGINLSVGYSQAGVQMNGASATTLRVREMGDNVADQPVTVANLSATAGVTFSGFYSI